MGGSSGLKLQINKHKNCSDKYWNLVVKNFKNLIKEWYENKDIFIEEEDFIMIYSACVWKGYNFKGEDFTSKNKDILLVVEHWPCFGNNYIMEVEEYQYINGKKID